MSTYKGEICRNKEYAAHITTNLCKFYQESMFLDVVLSSEGMKIKAHKNVLAASSEYFLQLFQNNDETVKANEVEIKEIEGPVLKIIIDSIYSGKIFLDLKNIDKILRGAVFLKIRTLVKVCCGFIHRNLDSDSCVRWFALSKQLCLSGLEDKCVQFILLNIQQVTKTSDFLLLDKTDLKDFLFNENRGNEWEEQVFLGLVAWVEHDRTQREGFLSDLLPMVRYQFLSSKLICEKRKSVCKTTETFELVMDWLQYHSSSAASTSIEDMDITNVNKEQLATTDEGYTDSYTICCFSENLVNEIEIKTYSEIVRSWSVKIKMPPLANHYSLYSSILTDDKLFIVGGQNSSAAICKNVTCLDLRTSEITDLVLMQVGRREPQLANLKGHLCVFGGFDVNNKFIESVEVFNFSTKIWSFIEPLKNLDINQTIVGHNGNLCILDNCYGSMQFYDIMSKKWNFVNLPYIYDIVSFCMASDDKYLYGFFVLNYDNLLVIKRFEFYTRLWVVMYEGEDIKDVKLLLDDLEIWILNYDNEDHWVLHNLKTDKIIVARYCYQNLIFPYKI